MPGLANRKRRRGIAGYFKITEFCDDAPMRLFCPTCQPFSAVVPIPLPQVTEIV
ncbi:hypothetical protein JJC00_10030 [Bradyrhizobium diazoefficiens]|uniref:hypothetical protein n=1 Tax=Bradyrhizobium diazoefficiens TaxID=1355477 RepID=UPI001909E835|nr:hypothetical protein [Bradyrhizobium diazoefficiens]QQO35876.1 hypothetical protein JJC00_10030 [Bradyrhizobium diazoefficiens]